MTDRFFIFLRRFFIPCGENNFRPQFFESGVPIALVIFLILLKFLDVTLLLSLPATSFFPQLAKEEIFNLTNKERSALGLPLLQQNPQLDTAALLKGQDMIQRGYFAHNDPAGNPPWYWIEKAGYRYASAGENLATGFLDAREVTDAWLSSPSHRANIVDSKYQEIGIAVFRNTFQGGETTLVVQLFGSPAQSNKLTYQQTKQTSQPAPKQTLPPEPNLPAQKTEGRQENTPQGSILGGENSGTQPAEEKGSITMRAVKTFNESGGGATEQITKYVLIFMSLAFALMIFIRFEIQHKDLLSRAFFIVFVIGLLFLLDRNFILSLLPHRLMI